MELQKNIARARLRTLLAGPEDLPSGADLEAEIFALAYDVARDADITAEDLKQIVIPGAPRSFANLEEARPLFTSMVWRLARRRLMATKRIQRDEFLTLALDAIPLPPILPKDLRARAQRTPPDLEWMSAPQADRNLDGFILRAKSDFAAMGLWHDPQFAHVLALLLDPHLIRLCWPARAEVARYEVLMCRYVTDHLVEGRTMLQIHSILEDDLRLSFVEALDISELAKAYATKTTQISQDHALALALLRLENYMQRCIDAADLTNWIKAQNQWQRLLGLNTVKQDDFQATFSLVAEEFEARVIPGKFQKRAL